MEPIVVEFDVSAPPEHAFHIWTDRCAMWWPKSHSMSQADGFDVVFEPRVGGRVYERGADGAEYEWGEVSIWDPPHRLEYLWHIFLDRGKATTVSVTFTPTASGTAVRLENSGFEVFGDLAEERAGRVGGAWQSLTAGYRQAVPE